MKFSRTQSVDRATPNTGLANRATFKEFVAALRRILPADAVLTKLAECKPFEGDALSAFSQVPQVVVLPFTVAQVQALVRLCHEYTVPLVSRGAGTGLSGGATPHANGVLMSMNRMNRVLQIDAANQRILVEPGITNLAVSQAVAHLGLFYAPDPSSQIASTIGGNIAENAGGVHCIKYGLTVHNLLAAQVVLADGELVTFSPDTGLDLLGVLTGSEGMLGVVVAAWLKLLPKPAAISLLLAGFHSVEDAAKAVTETIAQGITPAGMEMMDEPITRLIENYVHAGYPTQSEAVLLCELDGEDVELAEQVEKTAAIFRTCGATSVRIASDAAERELMWKGRKAAFPAVGREASDYYCIDGTVPRKHIGKLLTIIRELSKKHGLKVYNVFHAGDGNLHPLILYNRSISGELQTAMTLGDEILRACIQVGGTVTGEHGVGLEKLSVMCEQFHTDELDQFHRLRKAFDSSGIMNPGKAIPTLARCAELGGMHVHQGKTSFPELDRL